MRIVCDVLANIDDIVRYVSDTDILDWSSTTEALSGIGLTTDEQFEIFQVCPPGGVQSLTTYHLSSLW